jgi:hypothetical protein
MAVISFIIQAPQVDFIKLYLHKFTNALFKLDHFIIVHSISLELWIYLAYKKEWVKLHQNSFMRSPPVIKLSPSVNSDVRNMLEWCY